MKCSRCSTELPGQAIACLHDSAVDPRGGPVDRHRHVRSHQRKRQPLQEQPAFLFVVRPHTAGTFLRQYPSFGAHQQAGRNRAAEGSYLHSHRPCEGLAL